MTGIDDEYVEEDRFFEYYNEHENGYVSLFENYDNKGPCSSHETTGRSATFCQSPSSFVGVHDNYSYTPSRSSSHQMYSIDDQKNNTCFNNNRSPGIDNDDSSVRLSDDLIFAQHHLSDCSSSVDDNDSGSNNSIPESNHGIVYQQFPEILDASHTDSQHKYDNERSLFVDNSFLQYAPIRLEKSGVICMCRPNVIRHPYFLRIVGILDADVVSCLKVLPISVHNLVLRTKLWINLGPHYTYGRIENATLAKHTTTHHHTEWLIDHNDNPLKCYGIEFYNVLDYCFRMRYHWNCSGGLLLHEYCHVIHQIVLSLENKTVRQLYKRAKASGKYRKVVRRDWADRQNPTDLAYGMVDCKEFFAEFSVTYLSQGYRGLDNAPYDDIFAASPIILEPTLLSRLTKAQHEVVLSGNYVSDGNKCHIMLQHLDGHCNKFYPFTGGQFRHYDKLLFDAFDDIWMNISNKWSDSTRDSFQTCSASTDYNIHINYNGFNDFDINPLHTKNGNQTSAYCKNNYFSKSDNTSGCNCCSKWLATAFVQEQSPALEVFDDSELCYEHATAATDDEGFLFHLEDDNTYDGDIAIRQINPNVEVNECMTLYSGCHQMEYNNVCKVDLSRPLLEKKSDTRQLFNDGDASVCCSHPRFIPDTVDF
jgi:hypothetical protein